MEDIDGGLHPAVDGQSRDDDEDDIDQCIWTRIHGPGCKDRGTVTRVYRPGYIDQSLRDHDA